MIVLLFSPYCFGILRFKAKEGKLIYSLFWSVLICLLDNYLTVMKFISFFLNSIHVSSVIR